MRVKVIKHHSSYPFGVQDIPDERANYLIRVGVAEKVAESEKVEKEPVKEKVEFKPTKEKVETTGPKKRATKKKK